MSARGTTRTARTSYAAATAPCSLTRRRTTDRTTAAGMVATAVVWADAGRQSPRLRRGRISSRTTPATRTPTLTTRPRASSPSSKPSSTSLMRLNAGPTIVRQRRAPHNTPHRLASGTRTPPTRSLSTSTSTGAASPRAAPLRSATATTGPRPRTAQCGAPWRRRTPTSGGKCASSTMPTFKTSPTSSKSATRGWWRSGGWRR
mmetsp:Transcript_19787/g.51810  ORF Transcript_19787/g.51810 Transcript_19787/m.51810 type:complete len:203 (+) Transcript_19787:283-891(+)